MTDPSERPAQGNPFTAHVPDVASESSASQMPSDTFEGGFQAQIPAMQCPDVSRERGAQVDPSVPPVAFAPNAVEKEVQNVSSGSGAQVNPLTHFPPSVSSARESEANPTTAQLPNAIECNTTMGNYQILLPLPLKVLHI